MASSLFQHEMNSQILLMRENARGNISSTASHVAFTLTTGKVRRDEGGSIVMVGGGKLGK